jgi:hypothetical protein
MEAASFSATLVNIYQSTLPHIPDENTFYGTILFYPEKYRL